MSKVFTVHLAHAGSISQLRLDDIALSLDSTQMPWLPCSQNENNSMCWFWSATSRLDSILNCRMHTANNMDLCGAPESWFKLPINEWMNEWMEWLVAPKQQAFYMVIVHRNTSMPCTMPLASLAPPPYTRKMFYGIHPICLFYYLLFDHQFLLARLPLNLFEQLIYCSFTRRLIRLMICTRTTNDAGNFSIYTNNHGALLLHYCSMLLPILEMLLRIACANEHQFNKTYTK